MASLEELAEGGQDGTAFRRGPLARLRDVARLAGVSTATVSRSVNQPDIVSPELRKRIEKAIKQLNWVPHSTARALATRRTLTVGAVVPTLANEHFASGIEALQEALEPHGYTLLLACSEYDPERELRQARKMLERGVDAMVLVGEAHLADLYALLRVHGIPFFNTFTYRRDSPHLCIGTDNYRAIFKCVTHLLAQGHRVFGMLVQDTQWNDRARARLNGTVDALAAYGFTMRPEHLVQGNWGVRQGRELFRQLMTQPHRPTAVVCANGYLGIGAMLEASAMHIRVPRELSIVSFDDLEVMSQLPIPLTAVSVPSASIGRRTAELVIAQLTGKPLPPNAEFEAEFYIRESSGPAPQAPRIVTPRLPVRFADDL